MTDIQDNNTEMSVNSESKICAKGDAGSNNESNLVLCVLKKTDNDQNHALNGINGVDSIKNDGAGSNGTEKPELPISLEENVKLNGNSEAEALSVDKDEAAVSSTEKELDSGEDKPSGQDEKVDTETIASVGEKNAVKENNACTEVLDKSVDIPAESNEKADITTSTDVKEAESSSVEKSIADNAEESTNALCNTENEDIGNSTEIEKTNSSKENEPITETKETNDDSVEKFESEKANSLNETCTKVVEINDESAKPSESTNVVIENNEKSKETPKSEDVKTVESSVVEKNNVDEESSVVEKNNVDEESSVVEKNNVDEESPVVEKNNVDEESPVVEKNNVDEESSVVEKNNLDEEAPKPEQVENENKDEFALEIKPTDMDQEVSTSSETLKTSEELSQNDVEKMEVDEPDTAPDSSELPSSTVEEKSALNTDCRVVLVKVNESGESDDLDSDKKTKSPTECNRGIKRKRSSETDVTYDTLKHKSESENGEKNEGSSPVQKSKKQKVESSAENKTEEKESPSARKSKRLSDKKETMSSESEKSPSKRSRQSTPSSTPRKSITPSPKSKSKKDTESADDKSASESDKTPLKTATRVSSRTKRSLNLGDDEESTPASTSKRQGRKYSKATPKAKADESDNGDEVSQEEIAPRSAKKGRTLKSKVDTKSAKKSAAKFTTDDAQENPSGSDSEDDVDNSKSSKSRKSLTAKLDKMKRLLTAANLRVNNYAKFFKDCETDKEKIDHIVNHLRQNGLKGEPTLANCKILGKKIEQDKEIASLNVNNIIDSSPSTSGTRVTRSRRSTSRRA